jgi:hypothetical protein
MGKIIGFVIVLTSLVGCTRDLAFALPKSQPLNLAIYSDGRPLEKCTIAPGSKQFVSLETLLASYPAGWKPSPATYVPGVLVTGSGFSINFSHEFAVVSSGRTQLTHSIPHGAYAFLRCKDDT